MGQMTDQLQQEIDAAFARAIGTASHKECVDNCKLTYKACVDAGHSNCRDKLESCINSCPNGLEGGELALQTLLAELAEIDRRHQR